jgi:hypothetical protein
MSKANAEGGAQQEITEDLRDEQCLLEGILDLL